MTDARFPERWLNDRRIVRLPDDAFRLFVLSLAWSVANRTDGVLSDEDLSLLPGAAPQCARRLARDGLWERAGGRWLITVYEATQTTAAELASLDTARAADRARKRRERAHGRGDHSLCGNRLCAVRGDVRADVAADNTRPGQARTGTKGPATTKRSLAREPRRPAA
jgi:hypothetical protein